MPKLRSSVIFALLISPVIAHGQGSRLHSDLNQRRTSSSSTRKPPMPLVLLDSTRERDGLKGPVRRIETEVVRVELRAGAPVPKSRTMLERTVYDESGRRNENETYPVAGEPPTGRETHRYDAQGNLAETVVHNERGAMLSRTTYQYEFDARGNWTQMTASVAVSQAGRTAFEPIEITTRRITYYLVDEATGSAPPDSARSVKADNAEAANIGATTEAANIDEAKAVNVSAAEAVNVDTTKTVQVGAPNNITANNITANNIAGTNIADTDAAANNVATADAAVAIDKEPSPTVAGSPVAGSVVGSSGSSAVAAVADEPLLDVGVLNERANDLPKPAFPVSGERLEKPIIVTVEVVIDITGRVVGAVARGGTGELRVSSEQAARRAVFLPFYVAGRPVRAKGLLNYTFYFSL